MNSPSAATTALPAAAFYGGERTARWLGAALRLVNRVAPPLSERFALRLFFTPLPTKAAARRRAVPQGWQAERHPLEGGSFVLWRRAGSAGGRPGRDEPVTEPPRPPVLLVHGWAGDAMQMRALGDALHAAGFAPLLLDFPGHGRSDGWRSTLPQFVRTLFAVQARTGPLHAVVGHSLGALAAAHAAAKGLAVERLVLLSASPPPGRVLGWFAGAFGVGEALAQRMRHTIERREGVPLAQFEPGWIGPRLAQPTLLVHDRQDKAAPLAVAQALAQAAAHARLEVTEGLGHRRGLADDGVIRLIASVL